MTSPTTKFAEWANIFPGGSGTTPAAYVTEALGDEYATDFDGEAILGEFLARINDRLPAGLWLLGNGELIGEVELNAGDPVELVREAAESVDFAGLMEAHDITPRAATLVLYPVDANGQRGEPIDHSAIEDNEHAHQILRQLDDDPSASDLDCEIGDQFDYVVVDFQNNELRAARVTAR